MRKVLRVLSTIGVAYIWMMPFGIGFLLLKNFFDPQGINAEDAEANSIAYAASFLFSIILVSVRLAYVVRRKKQLYKQHIEKMKEQDRLEPTF
jgi:ABC-type Fe3+ transport system permease subunit